MSKQAVKAKDMLDAKYDATHLNQSYFLVEYWQHTGAEVRRSSLSFERVAPQID